MKAWKKIFGLVLVCSACTASSGPDQLTVSAFDQNPEPSFSAVIGQEVQVFTADPEPLLQPLSVSLIDSHDKRYPVTASFINSILTFRVPAKAATGIATVEVISGGNQALTGKMKVRRLGAIANRNGGNLLLFDLDEPQATLSFSLEEIGGFPEDVSISADGRFANVVMAGNPAAVSIEIATDEPKIASDILPTNKVSSALVSLPGSFLALSANFGDELDPGDSVDLFTLQSEGSLDHKIATLPVGSVAVSRPFDISTNFLTEPFALVSNREDASLTKISLENCLDLPSSSCAQLFTYTAAAIQEPTGIAISPQGDQALVADYTQDLIHVLSIDQNSMTLSGSLPLIGGDKGPVALRITPGGGKALVLNEITSTLAVLDLTQGFPVSTMSLALSGIKPGKLSLSHEGTKAWITFSGSNEIREVALNLFNPEVSAAIPVPGLNNPRGIAIQP